jgi:hypothetical protein
LRNRVVANLMAAPVNFASPVNFAAPVNVGFRA